MRAGVHIRVAWATLALVLVAQAASTDGARGHAPGAAAAAIVADSARPPAGLDAAAWSRIRSRLLAARYDFKPSSADSGFLASNPAHRLSARFGADGARVRPEDGDAELRLRTVGFGRAGHAAAVPATAAISAGPTLEYRHAGFTEWYRNTPAGLEQGYTVNRPPQGGGELIVRIQLDGDLRAVQRGGELVFEDSSGQPRAWYSGLYARDAQGKALPARMELNGARELWLAVNDAAAVYPLEIDPVISAAGPRVTASDGAANDEFGSAVSLYGDTLAVGVPFRDSAGADAGAVYVLSRNQGGADNWGEVAQIVPGDGATANGFGAAVSVHGDTLAVGAPFDDSAAPDAGAVYLFSRDRGEREAWGPVRKRTANEASAGDQFGAAVAIQGDVLVASAPLGGSTGAGAAYVFTRNAGGVEQWGQVRKLAIAGGAAGDEFGTAVALDGDAVVIGASGRDAVADADVGAAYIFSRDRGGTGNWGQVRQLAVPGAKAGDRIGGAVAIDGELVVVGAPGRDAAVGANAGAALVFSRNLGGADNWGLVQELAGCDSGAGDGFGGAVALYGDAIAVGADGHDTLDGAGAGAVYGFFRHQGGLDHWGEIAKFTGTAATAGDRFGHALVLHGEVLVAGAIHADTARGADAGSGQVFALGADAVALRQRSLAGDGLPRDFFGTAVAADGDTIIVGAPFSDAIPGTAQDAGAAYVFSRNQGGAEAWGQVQKLVAGNRTPQDLFGGALAVDGDTLVVGAVEQADLGAVEQADAGVVTASGAAYVFERQIGGSEPWRESARLTIDGADNDRFGSSVAVSGDTIVVGVFGGDTAGIADAGAAYVFARDGNDPGRWVESAQLIPAGLAGGDTFGAAVAADGDTIAVGNPLGDTTIANVGVVEVFLRTQGGADRWGAVRTLSAAGAAPEDQFGQSVALQGDTLVVGAPLVDAPGQADAGAVYVFLRSENGSGWGQVKKLTAGDAGALDHFGQSVALAGDLLAVGAPGAAVGAGSAYLFARNQGGPNNWGAIQKLVSAEAAPNDNFGAALALAGHVLAVGIPNADHPLPRGDDSGAADIFSLDFTAAEDYGDAPAPYPVLMAEGGARHRLGPLRLGDGVDAENDGVHSAMAGDDDDNGASDDEDGVTLGPLVIGARATAEVTVAGGTGALDAWVDFNRDGDWDDAGERIFNRLPLAAGLQHLDFDVPASATPGSSFARFRLSPAGLFAPTGLAPGGEVEDYPVTLVLPTLSIADVSLNEGDSGTTAFVFPVTLSHVLSRSITVGYATANDTATVVGGDYVGASGTVTFAAGETSKTVTVLVRGDVDQEPDESFFVNLSSPSGAALLDGQAMGTIVNDDTARPSVSLSLSGSPFAEDSGTATVTASLSAAASFDVTVFLGFGGTAAPGADYLRSATQIVIPARSVDGFITLTGLDDPHNEHDETVMVFISNVANATLGAATQVVATLVDDDDPPTVALSLSGSPLAENGGTAVVTAALSAPSGVAITVALDFAGTAAAGVDYQATAAQIVIPAGNGSGSIALTALDDSRDELGETVQVSIASVTNASARDPAHVTSTITDDDDPPLASLSLSGSPLAENGGVATVTATLSSDSAFDVTLTLDFAGSALLGQDYTRSASRIVIPAGDAAGSLTLIGVSDGLDEPMESVDVSISDVANGTIGVPREVTATLNDADPPPEVNLGINRASIPERGGNATVTAILATVSAFDVIVQVGFNGEAHRTSDFASSSDRILVAAGDTVGSLTLTALDDDQVENDEPVIVTITGADNASVGAVPQVRTLIVDDDNPLSESGAGVRRGGASLDLMTLLTLAVLGGLLRRPGRSPVTTRRCRRNTGSPAR